MVEGGEGAAGVGGKCTSGGERNGVGVASSGRTGDAVMRYR